MKSIYVIIDASSYINLSTVEHRFLNTDTLLDAFGEEVILRYSSTVNQEISSHWDNNMPDSLKRSAKIHQLEKYGQGEYEKRLFDDISQTSRDQGEKDNFAVALDLFFIQKKMNLVFLTDDDKAISGCLNEVKDAFPIIKIWNSFDAVLFLYSLKRKDFFMEAAENALQDLHKLTTSDNEKTDPRKMSERLKKLARYKKYLERIEKLHKRG